MSKPSYLSQLLLRAFGKPAGRWFSYLAVGFVAFLIGSTTQEVRPMTDSSSDQVQPLVRVTGIGGIFFQSPDPQTTRDWYRTHLGIDAADWGGFAFQWKELARPDETGYTVWGVFPDSTSYFLPSRQPYMLNYRVADLPALMEALEAEGVEIAGTLEQHPNGTFAWILDPDGRKIELWEPVPSSQDPYLE